MVKRTDKAEIKIIRDLLDYHGEFGEYPSAARLARHIGVTRAAVYVIFKRLAKKGILKYKSETIIDKKKIENSYDISIDNV